MKKWLLPIKACLLAAIVLTNLSWTAAQEPDTSQSLDQRLERFFDAETKSIEDSCWSEIKTLDDWQAARPKLLQELKEMLGLDPMPKKTDLRPVVVGTKKFDEYILEKLHFQSRQGLYVTANLYRPREGDGPFPTVLYVCGHSRQMKGNISYGNKAGYHHHGVWFAKHGYVCMAIDTIQLGEIEGLHHGTYRHDMWWWAGRGYTPAGVEAWNSIRALDYLETRPEVDASRFAVTGRSGGGVYSWWLAALDQRIKVAVPVAGITDLRNYVVDDCIEGHCDCMFMVNQHRWDFAKVAALVAPRPLLICNSHNDRIFPLDGVIRVYDQVERIYGLYGQKDKTAVYITDGPHKDTQGLRVGAFTWIERFLKDKSEVLITETADKVHQPAELRVFDSLPKDERVTTAHEWFVDVAPKAKLPKNADQWATMKLEWLTQLRKVKGAVEAYGFDPNACRLAKTKDLSDDNLIIARYSVSCFDPLMVKVYVLSHDKKPTKLEVAIASNIEEPESGDGENQGFQVIVGKKHVNGLPSASDIPEGTAVAVIIPYGVGPERVQGDTKHIRQIRRRFHLLGLTEDVIRINQVRAAIVALQSKYDLPVSISGDGREAGIALYAAIDSENVNRLTLSNLPSSHDEGPTLLGVRRIWDIPELLALASENRKLTFVGGEPKTDYYKRVAR